MNSLGVPFHYCPEAKETINLIHSMFFHMSIFKLLHISILMYLIQRESLPKTALYKRQRTPSTPPHPHPTPPPSPPPVQLLPWVARPLSISQAWKTTWPSKKQNNKRRNYDIVLLIHGAVNIPVLQVPLLELQCVCARVCVCSPWRWLLL